MNGTLSKYALWKWGYFEAKSTLSPIFVVPIYYKVQYSFTETVCTFQSFDHCLSFFLLIQSITTVLLNKKKS